MDIGLLQEINKLPTEIRDKIKAVGNDCFECVSNWNKENFNKPIENPVENYFQYGNKKDVIKSLKINGYLDITKLYIQDCCIAAGCSVADIYMGTSEVADQACCSYETAKKWAFKNNVKKITVGKKTVYQWTMLDLDRFIER